MKKYCRGCRALSEESQFCLLGYKTTVKYKNIVLKKGSQTYPYTFSEVVPLEPCPKPMTYMKLAKAESKFIVKESRGN